MLPELLRAATPVAGLAVNAAVQVALVRWAAPRVPLLRSLLAGFAAGFAATLALAVPIATGAPHERLVSAASDATVYAALGYCYFHFVNLGTTARRVRILMELDAAPRGLTRAEILGRYDARQIVLVRLERLVGTGQVVLRDGRYRAGAPLMTSAARLMTGLKRLVLGRASEFD